MAKVRRGRAADRRVRAHVPIDDPDAPGCCSICHVPKAAKNALHLAEQPAAVEAARALEDRQRLT